MNKWGFIIFLALAILLLADRWCDYREKVMEYHIKLLQYTTGETDEEPEDPYDDI